MLTLWRTGRHHQRLALQTARSCVSADGFKTAATLTTQPLLYEALVENHALATFRDPRHDKLVQAWAEVPFANPAATRAAAELVKQYAETAIACSCSVVVAWVVALASVPGSRSEGAAPLWDVLAAAAVGALIRDSSLGSTWLHWLGKREPKCALKDVSSIACTFAQVVPSASCTAAVLDAAAEASAAIRATKLNFTEIEDKEWRKLAWACAFAGRPHLSIFGVPDTRAKQESSQMVWESLQRLSNTSEVEVIADSAFPLLRVPSWMLHEEGEVLLGAAESLGLWEQSSLEPTGLLKHADVAYRTSQSAVLDEICGLSPRQAEKLASVRSRAASVFGLPETHVECPQLVRYGPGEYYKAHKDWAGPGNASLWIVGQRVATILVYMTDLPKHQGGATFFPQIGVQVAPERGTAIIWPNVDATGVPLEETEHEALPVASSSQSDAEQLSSVKIALNLWVRDRPSDDFG